MINSRTANFMHNATKLYIDKYPKYRYGQALMNELVEWDNALYTRITGTEDDPFYDDKRVTQFVKRVDREWNDAH